MTDQNGPPSLGKPSLGVFLWKEKLGLKVDFKFKRKDKLHMEPRKLLGKLPYTISQSLWYNTNMEGYYGYE